jgi:outer membrane protein assembly factor BamD
MTHRSPIWLQAALCLLVALALGACETARPKVKPPARLAYYEAQALKDQELYSEAITKFQEVADQNQGSLLGSFAYLQLADVYSRQEDWLKAETNYRLFLGANQTTHLTPYVLYNLVKVNHNRSFVGVLFPTREVDRDQTPNRLIIQEYNRFFFLYPTSVFLDEVRGYALDARLSLAEHERMVANFYFERGHYNAAAARYLYVLRNYPNYPESKGVLEQLVQAYRRNQQPEEAAEMERLLKQLSAKPGAASAAAPGDAAPTAAATPAARATGQRDAPPQ